MNTNIRLDYTLINKVSHLYLRSDYLVVKSTYVEGSVSWCILGSGVCSIEQKVF